MAHGDTKQPVLIYTDGACIGNPGPGGLGIVVLTADGKRYEHANGLALTTNNRAELSAAITALAAVKKPSVVTVRADSRYVVDGIALGWAVRWRANGWCRDRKGTPALNADLWARLLELCEQHSVTFEWVRGHAGDPENERCDELARAAACAAAGTPG
jgi:ribonuclease HI